MPGGTNGPPQLNGAAFAFERKTLAQLRKRLIARLGFGAMSVVSPGVQLLLDDILLSVNEHVYRRYHFLRQRHWWKVATVAGQRFYDIPYEGAYSGELTTLSFADSDPDTIIRSDAGSFVDDGFTSGMTIRIQGSSLNDQLVKVDTVAASVLTLDSSETLAVEAEGEPIILSQVGFEYMNAGRLHEAWVKEDEAWSEITQGINPALFNQTSQSRPDFFDIRQYIEVWPEPDKAYELYFYADKALTPLEHDADYLSVDDHAVFTLALAKAKFHYRQGDYQDYYQEFNVYVGKLNVDSFGSKRYVPCGKGMPARIESKPKATWR